MDTPKDQARIKKDLTGILKSLGIRDANIYFQDSFPQERLAISIESFAPLITPDDVLAYVDNTILNTGEEGLIITPDRIFIRNILYSPHMFKIRDIDSWSCKDNTLKFGNRSVFDSIRADVNKIRIMITSIREYLEACGPEREPEPQMHQHAPAEAQIAPGAGTIFSASFAVPREKTKPQDMPTEPGSMGSTTSVTSVKVMRPSGSADSAGAKMAIPALVAPLISKSGGYTIIMVALLRDKGPDKVLDIISRFPVIGAAGMLGKLVLGKPLQWLNEQMIAYGEPYIMKGLADFWQTTGITRDALRADIIKLPGLLVSEDLKQDSLDLLDAYLPPEEPGLPESPEPEIETVAQIENDYEKCSGCGEPLPNGSKFCPNCGMKTAREFKCPSCGHMQKEKMKFCPECGTPVAPQ